MKNSVRNAASETAARSTAKTGAARRGRSHQGTLGGIAITAGTGALAGVHGLVGYEAYDPDTDSVFNELSWEEGPEPRRWQPAPTVFEAAHDAGVSVTRVGPGFFGPIVVTCPFGCCATTRSWGRGRTSSCARARTDR